VIVKSQNGAVNEQLGIVMASFEAGSRNVLESQAALSSQAVGTVATAPAKNSVISQ
jgi:hypothetical protein